MRLKANYIYSILLTKRTRNVSLTRFLLHVANWIEVITLKYENTRKQSSKNHIVPQLLLKRFKVGLDYCNTCLYSYEKTNKVILDKPVSIRDICCVPDLYDSRDFTGKHSNFVDQKIYRDRLEANIAKVFDGFDEKITSGLTYFEELTFNNYAAFQLTRTLYFRRCLVTYLHILLETKQISMDDLKDEALVKKIFKNEFELPLNMLTEWMYKVNPQIIEGPRGKGLVSHLCLEISDSIARSMWNKNIQLLKVSAGDVLISDNPIVAWDLTSGVLPYLDWWNLEDKKFFLPISDSELIVITRDIPKNPIESDPSSCASFIELNNFGQYLTSQLGVYGKDLEKLKQNIQKFSRTVVS